MSLQTNMPSLHSCLNERTLKWQSFNLLVYTHRFPIILFCVNGYCLTTCSLITQVKKEIPSWIDLCDVFLWYSIAFENCFCIVFQVERWERQYLASTGEGKPARYQRMLDLARWLKEHVPEEDSSPGPGTGLVHGDYRPDNLVFHPTEVWISVICKCLCIRLCWAYNFTWFVRQLDLLVYRTE